MGRIHYSETNIDGCNEYNDTDFSNDFLFDEDSDLQPVILVQRGGCTFVKKVRNIEKLGVKLAIIADNKDEHSEELIMSDDGSGHSISIPSFIIRKQDAKKIIETIQDGINVYVKAELEIVHPDNRVEYELWYSSILDLEYSRLYDVGLYQKALSDNALFTPRIFTYECNYCSEEIKQTSCLSNGLYCPYFPKRDLTPAMKGVTELQLLEESLRQKCVYQVLTDEKDANLNFTKWFNYALNFLEECNSADKFNKLCAEEVMGDLKIPA